MALTCARCGTQNPDGNRFCTNCGTPLVPAAAQVPVAAGVGAPGAAPSPAMPSTAPAFPSPPAYQSPYYAPQPGMAAPAVHRTPWMVIISIIVATVLVLGGVGTVLALTLGMHSNAQGSTFSSLSSPSPAQTLTPGTTPSPAPSPSSRPSSPSGGQSVVTSTVTVAVPAGWQVLNKDDNSVTIESPDGDGTLTIGSGQQSPPQTAQQIKDAIDKALAQRYPDAAPCPSSSSNTGPIAGVNGIFWILCFTVASGGQSASIAEPIWAGANASGSVGYIVVLQTTQDNIDAFVQKCAPILQSGITWSLK